MRHNSTAFPRISNEMIDLGIRRARVERSKAVLSLIDSIFGAGNKKRRLSDG